MRDPSRAYCPYRDPSEERDASESAQDPSPRLNHSEDDRERESITFRPSQNTDSSSVITPQPNTFRPSQNTDSPSVITPQPKTAPLKHSAESLVAKPTTPTRHSGHPHQVKSDSGLVDRNSLIDVCRRPTEEKVECQDTSKGDRFDYLNPEFTQCRDSCSDLDTHHKMKHLPHDDKTAPGDSSRVDARSSVSSPDGYSADSESDSLTKHSSISSDPSRGTHLLPHQQHQFPHDMSYSRHEEHLKQQYNIRHFFKADPDKRDLFEKENRFLHEQKLLGKDSRSPPNVTVCQRAPVAHSLYPVCPSNFFGTSTSAFHHPMASMYINTSHAHMLPHMPPSSLPSSAASLPSSSPPPHRSHTASSVSSFLSSLSNPHLPHYLPTPHPAAMARAFAASSLPLSQHLAFMPPHPSSLTQMFLSRSTPSRYHPYAPNPVSPGISSSPDGTRSRSLTPSPASSPTMKRASPGVIKPLAISREMGLNLSTTDNRVVPV